MNTRRLIKTGPLVLALTSFGIAACSLQPRDPVDAQVSNALQTTPASRLTHLEPPRNSFLADSPWPIFHRNTYAQASSALRGPEPGDRFNVQFRVTPKNIGSPWTVLGERYGSGERPVYGSSSTHLFKGLVLNDRFEIVDGIEVNPNPLALNWNLLVIAGNRVILPDRDRRRFLKFADRAAGVANSPMRLEAEFKLPEALRGKAGALTLSYDGKLIFVTDEGMIAAMNTEFDRIVTFDLRAALGGEFDLHNNYPIDQSGNLYFTTGQRMINVHWDGQAFSLAWAANYDFRGPGCSKTSPGALRDFLAVARGEPCTGSGSTPTLMGVSAMDRLVLVTDGHQPQNHMVAFWRDAIPADWHGLPGFDRRVAAVTALPYSTPDGPGYSNENSPVADGYEIAVAQWNGFEPPCEPLRGVQKLRWDPTTRTMPVVWATDRVNFNNVLTYSAGSGLVYGSGRRGCRYYFWGLDWQSGDVKLEVPLGADERWLDQGNGLALNDDRSIIFGSAKGIVRIAPSTP